MKLSPGYMLLLSIGVSDVERALRPGAVSFTSYPQIFWMKEGISAVFADHGMSEHAVYSTGRSTCSIFWSCTPEPTDTPLDVDVLSFSVSPLSGNHILRWILQRLRWYTCRRSGGVHHMSCIQFVFVCLVLLLLC